MRSFHRWISTAAMLFLTWIAVTGVLLCLDGLIPAGKQEGPAANAQAATAAPTVATLPPNNLARLAADTTQALLSQQQLADGKLSSFSLQLSVKNGGPVSEIQLQTVGSPAAQKFAVTLGYQGKAEVMAAESAPAKAPTPWYDDMKVRAPLHFLLQDLHRGDYFGIGGEIMGLLTGLSFLILCVTGTVMYFQMKSRRKLQEQSGWFWN